MESLADLKELRENAEVNQETAAEWIGVVRSTYTRAENYFQIVLDRNLCRV